MTFFPPRGWFGAPKSTHIEGDVVAFAALAFTLVGIGVAFLAGKAGRLFSAGTALVGVVLLFELKQKIDGDVAKQGMVQVQYGIGYWLALFGYAAAFLLAVVLKPAGKVSTETPPNSQEILS